MSPLPEQMLFLPADRRIGDRAIWTGLGRVPDPKTDVPSIVVEFVSKRKRDRVRDYEEKRREYLALGVREYWIIDRFPRKMTVVSPAPAGATERVLAGDATYRTPLLPGFEWPLAQLWRLADDWTKKPRRGGGG